LIAGPVEKLRQACDANHKCDLFQTHGYLKACSGGSGPTNKTAACNPRTVWPNVDTYYKIRTPAEDAAEPVEAEVIAPGGFGLGQACGTAGNGCAGSFKRDVNFEMLPPTKSGVGTQASRSCLSCMRSF